MLVLWMGIQVTVMFFQDKFGPRFFVPKQFLPVKYDYRRPIPSFIVGRGITSHDDEAEQLISRGKGSPSLCKQSEGWCSSRFAFLAASLSNLEIGSIVFSLLTRILSTCP